MTSDSDSPRVEGKKGTQYLGAVTACLFALAAGTTLGWTSSAADLKEGVQGFNVTEGDWSWVGAIHPISAVASALPVGNLVNVFGRKRMLMFLVPIMLAGWAVIIWASAVWMLLLGRCIQGATTGAFAMVAPMYTSEIAEKSIRGTLGSYFQLLLVSGVLLVYTLALMKDVFWINVICAVPLFVAAAAISFLPDTPAWYMSKGRRDECRKSLRFFRGDAYDVDAELNEIEAELEEERRNKLSCMEAFSTRAAKRAILISVLLMIFQQFSGINAVIFYASDLFKKSGSSLTKEQSGIVVGVCLVLATAVSTRLIDKLGRKMLLLISGFACIVCNTVLGVYLYLMKQDAEAMKPYGLLPVVTMGLFMVLFSIGYGPIPWVYMTEVFTSQTKGSGVSIANMSNWFSVFLVTKFYGDLADAVGDYSTFWIFAGILVVGFVFTFMYLVETNGKSREQIQAELSGKADNQVL